MEYVNCNLCGSSDLEAVYEKPDMHYYPEEYFTVVMCRECGLGFVNPRPRFEEMSIYYPTGFYEEFLLPSQNKRYIAEAKYLDQLLDIGNIPRLLDVGCANGDFPRFMATKGWYVEGVEISQNSATIEDFPVHRGAFDLLAGRKEAFDVVTAWAVLEHVHNPDAYFRKATEVLRPGGYFVFLVTNFNSISSRKLFGEDVPRHLYFFTEDTITRYVEANGMKVVNLYYGNDVYCMPPRGWLFYLLTQYIKRRDFTWNDMPKGYDVYLKQNRLENNIMTMIGYILCNPVDILDRFLTPFIERYQIAAKTCGIVTCIARKA